MASDFSKDLFKLAVKHRASCKDLVKPYQLMSSMVNRALSLTGIAKERCCLLCAFTMWLQESPHSYRTECESRALESAQCNPFILRKRKLTARMARPFSGIGIPTGIFPYLVINPEMSSVIEHK